MLPIISFFPKDNYDSLNCYNGTANTKNARHSHPMTVWRHTDYIERCEVSESIINLHKTGIHNTRKINEMNQ